METHHQANRRSPFNIARTNDHNRPNARADKGGGAYGTSNQSEIQPEETTDIKRGTLSPESQFFSDQHQKHLKMANVILPKRLHNSSNDERMKSRIKNQTYFSIRESLQANIVHLYGEETFYLTKSFERLRQKKSSQLCDLRFLKQCRDNDIQPTFTRLSYHTKTERTLAILKKASVSLLKEEIRQTRKQLAKTERDLYRLHLKLSSTVHPIIWTRIDTISNWRTETDRTIQSEKHQKKIQRLQEKNTSNAENKKLVYNISDHSLSNAEVTVLSKGFNYAITPTTIPTEEIIANVESAISDANDHVAEQIRQDVTRILKTSRPPQPNLHTDELKALKNLNKNRDITILPADKGNATVVMNTTDYISKMNIILEDPAYKSTSRDPTTYLEKTTRTKIINSPIDPAIKKTLIPREKSSRCPKMYGLPKIHKEGVPLRPIVSAFNSPLQKLEKHLATFLQPSIEQANSYVRNSEHFTQVLRNISIKKHDILASFDVKSLYPSIPVDQALEQITANENLPTYVTDLAKHCLKNAYFTFDGKIYKQTDGAAMGSSLSPAIANLFMIYFEQEALIKSRLKPSIWKRYVDDIFVIWPHGKDELLKFLDHLNSIHPKIQFTLEIEENNALPFLDVLVTKTTQGNLQHTVYRKPTHTNRYLHAQSHHHPSQIQAVANTLITRSIRLTDESTREEEIKNISKALEQNGYTKRTIKKAIQQQDRRNTNQITENKTKAILPYIKGTTDRIGRILQRHNIPTAYKPQQTIRSMLRNPKDKVKLENQGVYSISCGTCHQTYIGQTNRRIAARLEEHKLSMKNKQITSALFQHRHNTGHTIDFDSCKQIANIEHYKTRLIREAIEIEKRGQLNKRDDALHLPATWKLIIKPTDVHPSTSQEQMTTTDRTPEPTKGAEPTEPRTNQRYSLRRRQI